MRTLLSGGSEDEQPREAFPPKTPVERPCLCHLSPVVPLPARSPRSVSFTLSLFRLALHPLSSASVSLCHFFSLPLCSTTRRARGKRVAGVWTKEGRTIDV